MKKTISTCLTFLLLLSVISGCGTEGKKESFVETKKVALEGKIASDGSGIIPLQDGTYKSISGEGYSIGITEDRKSIVFLEKDGALSVIIDENKVSVDADVREVDIIRNDSVIYSKLKNLGKYYPTNDYSYDSYKDNEWSYYRYSFISRETIELTDESSYKVAKNTGNILYSTFSEKTNKYTLNRLMADSSEYEVLLTSETEIIPVGISDDGSLYSWCEESGEDFVVYMSVNGEREKVFTITDNSSRRIKVSFNKAKNFAVISSYDSDYVALWTPDTGITKVKLTNELAFLGVYTDIGHLDDYDDVDAGTIYICTDEEANIKNLYAITLDGNREKIVSKVLKWAIRNDFLYYITDDNVLFGASVKDGTVTNESKIADGVCDFSISPDGSAIVYIRDVANDMIGSLYYYKSGNEKPVKIVNESYCDAYYLSYSGYWVYAIGAQFSNDGKGIYFFTDPDAIKDTSKYTATLQLYDIEKDEKTKIAADIMTTLTSEYINRYPEYSNLWYYKYISYDKDSGTICDLMFWNGESSTKLAKDIIY